MHPDLIRAVAAAQIDEWVAAADASRRLRLARRSHNSSRIQLPSWRARRRSACAAEQAART